MRRSRAIGRAGSAGAILASIVLAALGAGVIEVAPARPNVILVLVDTLRSDHLSTFGYARETSPQLTALARRGVAFSGARSQAPYTSKSIEALFTGDLPTPASAVSTRELPAWRETLAEHFRGAGYQTAGFSSNPLVSRTTGFAQGFDSFEMERFNYRPATEVLEAGIDWMSARDPARPFLLYLHLIDTHAPYAPPRSDDRWRGDYDGPVTRENSSDYVVAINERGRAAFEREAGREVEREDVERLVSLYDGAIHFVDRVFAAFFHDLDASGRLADTLVVLVSDHGEEFMEHASLGHGHGLFEHQVRVPLLMWGPGVPEDVRVDDLVAVADVMPTLLDLAGLPRAHGGYGQSLRPLWYGDAVARTSVASLRPSGHAPQLAVRVPRAKYLEAGDAHVYDLARDPAEQHPIDATTAASAAPRNALWLRDQVRSVEDRLAELHRHATTRDDDGPESPILSPDIEAQLRALGYAVEH